MADQTALPPTVSLRGVGHRFGDVQALDDLTFDVPASCGGSTPVCCPGGNPQSPCGPIVIDLAAHPGDLPRMELRPAQGASRLDVTVRARVRSQMDIPVTVPLVLAPFVLLMLWKHSLGLHSELMRPPREVLEEHLAVLLRGLSAEGGHGVG